MNTNKVFLTIKLGNKSEENQFESFKRFIGVAPVNILAVNPNKVELGKIQGREIEQDIEYMTQGMDGKNQLRLDFWIRTDNEWGNKIDLISKVTFFISSKAVSNRDNTKVKVIDKYGETAWVTEAEYKAGKAPEYAKRFSTPYTPCHQGEEELVKFLKAWLNIPDSTVYKDKQWVKSDRITDAEIQLNWAELCKNNLKELKELVTAAKDYKVKVCFGVRTTDDNRQYQDVCNRVFLKNGSTYYQLFDKEINSLKENGAYPNTEFTSDPLMEYMPKKTQIEKTPVSQPDDYASFDMSVPESQPSTPDIDDLPF